MDRPTELPYSAKEVEELTDSEVEIERPYSPEEAEAINDSGAATYAAKFESRSLPHLKNIYQFIELADLKPGEHVLDLGCGNAAMAIAAKSKVVTGRVIAVDISGKMLQLAHDRVADAGFDGRVELLKGNVEDLSAIAASSDWPGFDVILCRRLICNLGDRQAAALRHFASFLAPGGRIVTDQIYPYQLLATAEGPGVPGEYPPFHIRLGMEANWRKIEDHFRQQVQDTGLRLDTVQDLQKDGLDVSGSIFAEAQEEWTGLGKTGRVSDACLEEFKHLFLAADTLGDPHLEFAAILCLLSRA